MKNLYKPFLFTIVLAIIFYSAFSFVNINKSLTKSIKIRSTSSPKAPAKMKKARQEYFNRMLQDPKTKTIPPSIRQKELAFAKKLSEENIGLNKTALINELDWKEAGPGNVGGRTRALAVDVTNSNIIIAGGASGGIWKSTDKGNSWSLKSTNTQILSVTNLAQDTRPGHTNNWYYGAGEFMGSAEDQGRTHRFSGDGIYKSTDNGETWSVLPSTFSKDFTKWDIAFDFIQKIEISPTTGTIFATAYSIGIFKSTDQGATFSLALGGSGHHGYTDLSIAKDGTIAAVVSPAFDGYTATKSTGVYKSTDDGNTWTKINVPTFPEAHIRGLIEIAPSNNNIAYVLTYVKDDPNTQTEEISFHKINISNGSSEDRSANLPKFQFTAANIEEGIKTQGGYNLTLAVKPDNENFIVIGATSLFRSTDGFATKPSNPKLDWIGGYHPIYFGYPNFHPDIHSYCFEANNPNAVWWGHDGGLSYTSDITQTNYQDIFPWENKNNGYNVTQFYHISISKNAGDSRIMGGTQDNGTPFFESNGTISNQIADVSSGDGYYSYFGNSYAYTSIYNGNVMRLGYDGANYPNIAASISRVYPSEASNQLFLNPFAIDPTDEDIMYYPSGNSIWRNNQLGSIPNNEEGTTFGWTKLDNLTLPAGYLISAIAVSKNNPSHRFYYGGVEYSQQSTAGTHKIFRLDNANNATSGAVEISIPGVPIFSFLNNIFVNPDNADEIIVIFSNYNIVGVYHSMDAGQTFTPIEGNLIGDENNPGPSIRSAAILPTVDGLQYFLGTSIGVFSTLTLDGNNTNWIQEGINSLGNVVVASIATRKSDAKIVAGTHGRGAFLAYGKPISNTAIANVDLNNLTLQSRPGQNGSTSFQLKNIGGADLTYNITVSGGFNKALNKTSEVKNYINKPDITTIEYVKKRNKTRQNSKSDRKVGFAGKVGKDSKLVPNKLNGNDILVLDDGNVESDDFFGYPDGSDLYWVNEFNVSGFNFELDAFQFFMQTGLASSNFVDAGIYDEQGNLLSFGTLTLQLAPSGGWFEITLNPTLTFTTGDTFVIEIVSKSSIPYAAGVDTDAKVKNKSSYFNWGTSLYDNLNTITGFENGAFLIRAVGTKSNGGGGNQNPKAVANVSKTQAAVNESITFDASQSTDNDGQITQYLWNFGDGTNSNQKTVTHSYSQANTYNYSLTVTDNQGATGQATGQIIVSSSSNNIVTVSPASGSITPGGSKTITLTLNAQTISEGTYSGQVSITTNGGNITIPIDYLVDVEKISSLPNEFSLSQNYPNPFNPTTNIEFSLPQASHVSLKVYDVLGKEVYSLINEEKVSGKHKVSIDGTRLTSGVYFYKLVADNFSESKKMLLIR